MTDEADVVLTMFRCVELIGGWKTLNWLSGELEKGVTLGELTDQVNHALSCLEKKLGSNTTDEHFLLSPERIED